MIGRANARLAERRRRPRVNMKAVLCEQSVCGKDKAKDLAAQDP